MPECNLCNEVVDKFVDSHIIPKSIHYLSTQYDAPDKSKIIMSDGKTYPERSPKGVYDQFVCKNCEGLFGEWDEYAFKFFKKVYRLEFEQSDQYIEFGGYDYKKLKLFFISLLWRADAAKKQLMYNKVDVGDSHRKTLANMIKEKNPGGWQEYAVFMERYKSKRPAASIIRSPARAKMPNDGTRFYIFYMAGFKVYIKCDQRCVLKSQESYYLRENGKMLIPLMLLEESKEHLQNVQVAKLEKNKNAFS